MATVPIVSAPSVGVPDRPLRVDNGPNGASILGEALSSFGQVEAKQSDLLAQRALEIQAQDNKAAADGAIVRVAQAQDTLAQDYRDGNRGLDAYTNLPTAFSALEDVRAKEAASLPNDAAREMYTPASRLNMLNLTRGLATFAGVERHQYLGDQVKARIGLIQQQQAQDPTQFDALQPQLGEQLATQAHMEGWSPEQLQAEVIQHTSTGVLNVLQSLAPRDPTAAQAFLDQHADSLTPAQKPVAESIVRAVAEPRAVAALVDRLVAGAVGRGTAPIVPGAPAPSATTAPPSQRPLTTGADIAAILGANVRVTSGLRTPEHNAEVGGVPNSLHLQNRARDFVPQGMSMAAATVKLRAAGYHAINEGDHVHVDWGGSGGHAVATVGVPPAEQALDRVEASVPTMLAELDANPMFIGRPDLRDQAEGRLLAQVGRMRQAQTIATAETFDRLLTAGVQGNFDSVGQYQNAYPGAMGDWMSLSGAAQRNLTRQAATTANALTPDRQLRINELVGLRDLQPGQFSGMDLTKENLPLAVIGRLQHDQNQIRTKAAVSQARQARINSFLSNEFVKQGLQAAGLKPDSPEWNQFTGAASAALDEAQAAHPKVPLSDQEYANVAAGLLAKRGQTQTFLPTPFGDVNLGGPHGGDPAFTVPADEEAKIRSAIEPRVGRPLTPAEVGRYYHLGQAHVGR